MHNIIQPQEAYEAQATPQQNTEGQALEQRKGSRVFPCPHCGKTYPSSRSLGGHISKAHPGSSDTFTHKIKVRKERTHKRMALTLAKELLRKHTDPDLEVKVLKTIQAPIRFYIEKVHSQTIRAHIDGTLPCIPDTWYDQLRSEILQHDNKLIKSTS